MNPGSAKDFLKSLGRKGVVKWRTSCSPAQLYYNGLFVAEVDLVRRKLVWLLGDLGDCSELDFDSSAAIADYVGQAMDRRKAMFGGYWKEGRARDFLKAQGRRLRWTDEVIQGRLSWFGWDDSLRQTNRHGVAAAKIVRRRTGEWMIVWIEKMDRDFVHTFQTLEDAQRYAEKQWFDEGRANWEEEEYNRNHVW